MKYPQSQFNQLVNYLRVVAKKYDLSNELGQCDMDVKFVSTKPYVQRQLNAIDKAKYG